MEGASHVQRRGGNGKAFKLINSNVRYERLHRLDRSVMSNQVADDSWPVHRSELRHQRPSDGENDHFPDGLPASRNGLIALLGLPFLSPARVPPSVRIQRFTHWDLESILRVRNLQPPT